MDKIQKIIVYLYLFACPLVSAFSLNAFISISFICSVFISLFYFLSKHKPNLVVRHRPSYLLIYWLLFTFSYVVFSTGEKCFNQYAMWTWSFFIFYYTFSRYIITKFDYVEIKTYLFKALSYGLFFTCSYVIIESICKNFIFFPIESYIPRTSLEEMDSPANVMDAIRCRGFMQEPSFLANYIVIIAPITFYWILTCIKQRYVRICLFCLIALALFLSFSSGGFAVSFFSICLLVRNSLKDRTVSKGLKCAIAISFFVVFCFICFTENIFLENITYKISSNGFFEGDDRRAEIYVLKYLDGINSLFGYGPAAYSTLKTDTFINLVLNVIMNTGYLGLLLFVLFLLQVYNDIKRIKETLLRQMLVLSFLNACLYFLFSDALYVTWFWIIASFGFIFRNLQNRQINKLC